MLKQYLIDAAIENAEDTAQAMQSRIELQVRPKATLRRINTIYQDKNLLLHFATKIEFYCFKWTFVCSLLEDEYQKLLFLKHSFVKPLLVIANEFSKQIEELQAILAQKGIHFP